MPFRDTIRHTALVGALLAGVLLGGCSSSHAPGSGEDAGGGDASVDPDGGECPPIAGSCHNDCCTDAVPATFDEDCSPICPDGYRFIDRCAPAPGCGVDGGTCPPIDPGFCYGGPCCGDRISAEVDSETCTAYCPEGYAREDECEVDPAALCAAPWRMCEHNAECELAFDTCCGTCGEPTLADYDAINGEYREEHRESVCPEPEPCPACAVGMNPALGATCDGGLCRGFDVRSMELSACDTDDDCRLRATGCCECGADTSPHSLIAIRTDAADDYRSLLCEEEACPECEPYYPTDEVEAYCADDGHCDVRSLSSGGE